PSMSLRRVLVAFGLLAALAAVAYTAYWFHVAGQLRKGIEGWADHRRSMGWTVEWRSLQVGGFPGGVRADMAAPHLASPAGWRWRGESLAADASPFDITRVALHSPGRHLLAWGGQEMAVTAGHARADLDFRDGTLDAASVALADVESEGWRAATVSANFDPQPPPPDHDGAGATFAARVQRAALPEIPGLVLEREIAFAEIAGRVMGPLPVGAPVDALMRWSAEGGTVEIDRLALDWAPMGMEAEGTFAFDPALQPLLTLSARVRGFSPLMDRLNAAGMVDAGASAAAKLLLSMMSKPDAQGRPAVPVPVTLQEGMLFFGPAKVARVPPIQWPGQEEGALAR
ncbi:MAG TPA: DUF2125 domain-containing protein, partial [Candidatus Omnitrophota bacterium]|nr:DUF2125 domain-containing protein [Candidatus Omnitrophota bacterium]